MKIGRSWHYAEGCEDHRVLALCYFLKVDGVELVQNAITATEMPELIEPTVKKEHNTKCSGSIVRPHLAGIGSKDTARMGKRANFSTILANQTAANMIIAAVPWHS